GLRGAAREDDVLGLGIDQARDLVPRGLDRLLRLPAEGVVPARRVAEDVGEEWPHRLEHPRIHGRRGVVDHLDSLAAHADDPLPVGKIVADNPSLSSPLYGCDSRCQPLWGFGVSETPY